MNEPAHLIVGVAGGTASGKSTFAELLVRQLGSDLALAISHDSYYRDLEGVPEEERARTNFDHPESLDNELLAQHLDALRTGESIEIPRYDFRRHARAGVEALRPPRPIVIVEGVLALAIEDLLSRFDLRVFVDAPDDLRLGRRVRRDVARRGRSPDSVLQQYESTTKPMHDQFVAPCAGTAHFTVRGDRPMGTPVMWMAAAIRAQLAERLTQLGEADAAE